MKIYEKQRRKNEEHLKRRYYLKKYFESRNAFSKDSYHRSELLDELLALQEQAVVISGTGSGEDSKRVWDVEKHLKQLSKVKNGIADESLDLFHKDCANLSNSIKAEISGHRGEEKAFSSLERISIPHFVVQNLGLTQEDKRTEIDAAVITSKGIFIVEVKNTRKDIFIDAEGNMYRMGEYKKLDCNIAEKMSVKKELLKNALEKAGMRNVNIFEIVVFTDNRIEIRNRHDSLKLAILANYHILSMTIQVKQSLIVNQ